MRKTKAFRPRRGIHFSDDRGKRPAGGFVGGPSTDRTRPTVSKRSLQLKKFASVVTTGSVGRSVSSPSGFTHFQPNPGSSTPVIITGSIFVGGSVSYGRKHVKAKYNSTLLGLSTSNAFGAAPYSSVADVNLTGTFTSPSWTHKYAGFNQAFVGVSLTSSYIETRTLNYFRSGSAPLESSPVPASASLFYSKQNRFQTIVVKHTASALDCIASLFPSGTCVPSSFAPLTGAYFTTSTSSVGFSSGPKSADVNYPATILMNVPVSGRLTDIKVWVELVHISASAKSWPLQSIGVALRSPNVTWGMCYPILNDPQIKPLLAGVEVLNDTGGIIEDFHRDTFILWDQGRAYNEDATFSNGGFDSSHYPTWQKDRGMRTVFSDGARVPNPRHLYNRTSPSGCYIGAPNAYEGTSSAGTDGIRANSAYGCNVPWTSDLTVGGMPGTTYALSGSPPQGWLSGPGGSANVNEWPTTGVNYGAPYIRPFLPLLDSIYCKKVLGSEGIWLGNAGPNVLLGQVSIDPNQLRGFRPGLRGTEISGTWSLLLVGKGVAAGAPMDVYFRQARLEITYDSAPSSEPVVRRSMTRRPARRGGETYLFSYSGSDASHYDTVAGIVSGSADYFVNQVYSITPFQSEVGRTFGVTLNSGTVSLANTALLYRLSGNLASISGSTPGWLTNNQFGMPQIPFSSASLVHLTATLPSSSPPTPFISPTKLLDGPRRLADAADDVNPKLTLVQLAAEFVSGTNT